MSEVSIVPTGTANLASVEAAFIRLGHRPVLRTDPRVVTETERVVIPGVGTFGAAMGAIDDMGLRRSLRQRIEANRPTLAICVGMQLLADTSDESQGARGLGAVAAHVARFDPSVKVPQLGWNLVQPDERSRFVTPGWAYFANSYRIDAAPPGWAVSVSEHGGRFASALERGEILALQFHPELSGAWGQSVLRTWLSTKRTS